MFYSNLTTLFMAFEAERKFTTKCNSPHNNSLGVLILIKHNNLTILHMYHPNQLKHRFYLTNTNLASMKVNELRTVDLQSTI